MQDPKKINVSSPIVANGKTYSIEFHEDNHDTNVKVVDGGVATYYPVGGGGGGGQVSHPFEFWTNINNNFTLNANSAPGSAFHLDTDTNVDNTPSWMTNNLFKNGVFVNTAELNVGQVVQVAYSFRLIPSSSGCEYIFYTDYNSANGAVTAVVAHGDAGQSGVGRIVSGTYSFTVLDSDMKNPNDLPSFTCRLEGPQSATSQFIPLHAIVTVL